jgi:hypothetical protein
VKKYTVKDLMVPISEYATVLVGTTLIDAIRALERAQEVYTERKYEHRAVLVLDHDGNVVGKIGQLRALKAIEPDIDFEMELDKLKKFGFSEKYLAHMRDQFQQRGKIITSDLLRQAATKKVEEFMQAPTPGQYVAEDCRIDTAISKLVSGTHLSLLVTRGKAITGILRISDVFAAVFHEMTSLEI